MNDDKLLEKIKQSAQSCDIPEGLEPENIGQHLDRGKKPAKMSYRRIYQIGGVAAAVLVVVLLAVGIPKLQSNNHKGADLMRAEKSDASMAQADVESGEEAADMPMTQDEAAQKALLAEGQKNLDQVFRIAKDYDDVTDVIELYNNNLRTTEDAIDYETSAAKSADMATEESAAADTGGGNTSDYSTTNLQVEGVDEGDIVKTDGNYLYIIRQNRSIRIVKIDGAKMEEVTTIRLESEKGDESVRELYLTGKTLNIITQGYVNDLGKVEEDTYYMDYRTITNVYTYDLSDPTQPQLTGKVSQDGNYNTSRKVGDYLYLFTGYYSQKEIPFVGNEKIAATDIYLPVQPCSSEFTVISSVNVNQPDKILDKKAILQSFGEVYVSTENIYIRNQNWNAAGDTTSIAKFHFANGKITGESAAVVRGSITDTFAINEYEGYLRVLTTSWGSSQTENQVYVLSDKMEIVGRIEGLAKGETIYSARFMGKTGYFVTYRQVDPLFSVDFSDPTKPQVLGELKITGFSEYLHFYGEKQLLGIGWETDPETGTRIGLKLSMFDISDSSNVKEIAKTVIKNIDSFPGEYDYKALTVNPDKNVIGLMTNTWNERSNAYTYMVFSYADKTFKNQLTHTFATDDYSNNYENARGVYVGDTFYVVAADQILAFDMNNNYKKTGELLQ